MNARPKQRSRPSASAAGAVGATARAGDAPLVEVDTDAVTLLHELHVHQIELETQNEELRRAQQALEVARDRYTHLYDFAPVAYLTLDGEGGITEANLTGASLLGTGRARLIGSRFVRRVAPAHRERWVRFAHAVRQRGGAARCELPLLGHDDQPFDAQIDALVVAAPAEASGLRIAITDVSERVRAQSELKLAAAAFEVEDGIVITDARGVIERVNRAFTRITGYGSDEAIGQRVNVLRSGRQDASFYAAMWDHLRRHGTWHGEVWNRRKSGEVYPQSLTITAVPHAQPEQMRYVATMRDISEAKARETAIERLAFYDPLTGLPNRRLLQDRLNHEMAVSARTGHAGALLFIDLDDFKVINDSLGHEEGDRLLQRVARRITDCVREGDTVARLGGDEFVVVLATEMSADAPQAEAMVAVVAEKILDALRRPFRFGERAYPCTGSIGACLFVGHELGVNDLINRADQAMYQAKAAGRNTLRSFDSHLQERAMGRLALEAELRQAMVQGDFVLHYQPLVDGRQQLLGAEALVRWRHDRRGLVEPSTFIPVAEECGLIFPLGRWVLQSACEQLAAWATEAETAALTLAVNISARQLHDHRFVAQVLDVLQRTGADARRLRLELTESVMLADLDDSVEKLNALKAHGVGFSLDDFGTGYASMTYLKRLPLDQLKIDRSFVRELLTDPHDAAIVRTVADLGQRLGLMVVAEGVETEAQRERLSDFGCTAFQGDLFGQAAPAQQLLETARRLRAGTTPPRH